MAKAPKTDPFKHGVVLHYDLKQSNGIFRLGVHGLWRLLAAIDNDPKRYPNVVASPDCTWKLGDDTITLTATTPEHLLPLLVNAFGQMVDGVIVLPGYSNNMHQNQFYLTALTHTAITMIFANNGKNGRTKALSSKPHCALVRTHAPNYLMGGKPKATVPLGSKFHREVSLHFPYPTLVNEKMFVHLGDNLIRDCRDKGISLNGTFHPGVGTWNNNTIEVPFSDAFALFFSPLAYVYSTCTDGLFGVGMDAPTFTEAADHHKRHCSQAEKNDGKGKKVLCGTVVRVHGGVDLAARVLLGSLDCQQDRTYSVVLSTGVTKDFFFTGVGDGLFGTFNQALQESLETSTGENGFLSDFQELREVPVVNLGSAQEPKFLTVFDKVDSNLAYGLPWCQGLESTFYVQQKGKAETGLWPSQKKILGVLMSKMSTDNEKLVMTEANQLVKALGFAYGDYDRAEKEFVAVHMGKAVGSTAILAALAAYSKKAGRGFASTTFDIMLPMLDANPRRVKALLVLGATMYVAKVEDKPVVAA